MSNNDSNIADRSLEISFPYVLFLHPPYPADHAYPPYPLNIPPPWVSCGFIILMIYKARKYLMKPKIKLQGGLMLK